MGLVLECLPKERTVLKANFPLPVASSLSSTPAFSEAADFRVEITQK